MTAQPFDDETLMAFADGELDDATSAAVERAINDDAALAARVALFMDTRLAARKAFDPMLDTPVPASLRQSVERMIADAPLERDTQIDGQTTQPGAKRVFAFLPRRGNAVSRPQAANQNRMTMARRVMPVAASLLIVAAGAVGYMLGASDQRAGPAQIALVDVPGLQEALATVASGEEAPIAGGSGRFTAIASFRDSQSHFCREFEMDAGIGTSYVAVACQEDATGGDAWTLAFAAGTAHGQAGEYRPASSLEALDAYLTSIDAGPPLSPEDEAAALAQVRR